MCCALSCTLVSEHKAERVAVWDSSCHPSGALGLPGGIGGTGWRPASAHQLSVKAAELSQGLISGSSLALF